MSSHARPDLDPVLRRAFMAPAIAEWTRVLGKSLIVSTTEDDETAAANCAVEVVLSVEGAVRGKVTYTLPAQTVLSIASVDDHNPDGVDRDPIPAITEFFKSIATRAGEMLQSSGAGSAVSLARVRDVRGNSYTSPVTNPYTVHMVTQPSHKDPSSPQPVSLWFDLAFMSGVAAPQAAGGQRQDARPATRDDTPAAEPGQPAAQQGARRSLEKRQPAAADAAGAPPASAATGAAAAKAPASAAHARKPGKDGMARGPGYTPVVRTGRMEIVDETGTARAVISTLADGSPHIVFADRDGRIRAAISLARDGQPRILFLDDMGRRILDLPHLGSSSQNANQPARRAGPPPGSTGPHGPVPGRTGTQPPPGNGHGGHHPKRS